MTAVLVMVGIIHINIITITQSSDLNSCCRKLHELRRRATEQ